MIFSLFIFQAIQAIDVEISQQLAIRRKHREAVGPKYFNSNMYAQGSMSVVPEQQLCPKSGHLSLTQQRVYEVVVTMLI